MFLTHRIIAVLLQVGPGGGGMQYLLSTYRVGMLALETLGRKVHDDRPQAKYARNPSYGEDVKWLLNVAKKLGRSSVEFVCSFFSKHHC